MMNMTGMGHGLGNNDPTIGAAFRSALQHQFGVIVLLAVLLILAWNVVRTLHYRRSMAAGSPEVPAPEGPSHPEPVARRVIRITFGLLWIFDGLLQAQGSMPLGLPGGVITPAAGSSPGWVQHLVAVGTTIWTNHPVSAAAATVWIQIGVGAFLLVAPRGNWSRAAGAVSAGWGLVVWVFGEAFGGIFGHGSSWLFGSPGAAAFYVVAGLLLVMRESAWETPRLGKSLLRGMGVFYLAMGLLQAWPGRGFWSGQPTPKATPGAITAMAGQMAQVSQPSALSSLVRSFGSLDAAHGWAVNLIAVVFLFGIGACFVSGRRQLLRVGVIAGAVFGLAVWIFVQDFGFLGGVGTDPNSMIPIAAVFLTGYLAVVRLPAHAPVADQAPAADLQVRVPAKLLDRWSPAYLLRWVAAVGAMGVVLVGAAPMALASTNPNADPILAEAGGGAPNLVDSPAPSFTTLTNQNGHPVSLKDLAGHTVIMTFLDPVCVSDCPLIASELRLTDSMLGNNPNIDIVAIVDNPLYTSTTAVNAFDQQEGLDHLPNWQFLTGSLPNLQTSWANYGSQSEVAPTGAMITHSDIVYIIDRHGHLREVLNSAPKTLAPFQSSFSALLANQAAQIARS